MRARSHPNTAVLRWRGIGLDQDPTADRFAQDEPGLSACYAALMSGRLLTRRDAPPRSVSFHALAAGDDDASKAGCPSTALRTGFNVPALRQGAAAAHRGHHARRQCAGDSGVGGIARRLAGARAGLRGRGTDTDDLNLTSYDTLRRKLGEALRDGRAITADIRQIPVLQGDRTAEGLPRKHAYAVLDYDPKTDMITLMNPWGHGEAVGHDGSANDGVNDGIFQLSLTDFNRLCASIAYEQ